MTESSSTESTGSSATGNGVPREGKAALDHAFEEREPSTYAQKTVITQR